MNDTQYMITIDQGTTSSRVIIFDHNTKMIAIAQQEITQIYPQPGWVEHDPIEIIESITTLLQQAINKAQINIQQIAGLGITNQRETTVVWNKETGKPIYNAIVWQCRRTTELCESLKEQTHLNNYIRENTGLVLDPYFSASKIKWILDNVEGASSLAKAGKLLFGTIDSWIVWNLSNRQAHITDYSNASRTMLFNINSLQWDTKLLATFSIPHSMLPSVKSSSEIVAYTQHLSLANHRIPIAGIAGDQQAALFGQMCVNKGQAKNTYGTGCFLLMNTGHTKVTSQHGLLTTLACDQAGHVCYALEGSIFMAGAAIQWLRDELHLIEHAADSERLATQVDSSGGVYLVPAFTGLGAPYWDPFARGTLVGLTRGTKAAHIIRATLECIAYQTHDILYAMQADSGIKLTQLRVDGGAVGNNFLMQFQANILNTDVDVPKQMQVTALGAAYLAGLAVGYWENLEELQSKFAGQHCFKPDSNNEQREKRIQGWQHAVSCAQSWSQLQQLDKKY